MSKFNFDVEINYMGETFSINLDSSNCSNDDILSELQDLFKQHLEEQEIETDEQSEFSEDFSIENWGDVPKFLQDLETLQDFLENSSDYYGIEVYEAAAELDIPFSDVEEAYSGEFDSDEDFARNMAEETGAINNDLSWPYTCIDWEFAAKELMYDYCEANNHYFRNI